MIIATLSPEECATILAANHTASLACVHDNRPYVVPITYAYANGFLYSFSREGQKLAWMRDNTSVSLLIVERGVHNRWKSVVVSGTFEEFSADPHFDYDNDFAWKALKTRADWWEPGSLKPGDADANATASYTYYCIHIVEVTGRSLQDER